jgi:adenylyl cyclase-associated protein
MSTDLNAFNSILQRLEAVADRLEKGTAGGGAAAGSGAAAPAADEAAIAVSFDAFVKDKTGPIEAAASTLAVADVTEATQFFMDALRCLRSIFAATGSCRKPKDDEWMKFFGPYSELTGKAGKACDNRSDYFHNRKAACEALGLVTLVTVPGPSAHVQQILEMMDFHAIKVMQKKNPPETAWINALKTCLKDLVEWCKENCKMGLDWKVGGQDPVEYFQSSPLGSAPGAAGAAPKAKGKGKGAPPMPKGGVPAPPPPEDQPAKPAAAGGGGGGMAEVFNEIEKYKNGTGGLKKVTDDMKCKNLKDKPVVVAKAKAPAPAAKAAAGGRFAKGPKGDPIKTFQAEQHTWIIQNFDGNHNISLDEVEKQQCVRVTDCRNTTVKLGDRVKGVTVDNCERTNIIVKDVISVVELVNSDRIQCQTAGKVNMIAVDKCNGVMIHLNKDSLAAEIVTSKSSEMNVTIPDPDGDEYDTVEIPIPEQFVTTIVGKKTKTTVSSLYSD